MIGSETKLPTREPPEVGGPTLYPLREVEVTHGDFYRYRGLEGFLRTWILQGVCPRHLPSDVLVQDREPPPTSTGFRRALVSSLDSTGSLVRGDLLEYAESCHWGFGVVKGTGLK